MKNKINEIRCGLTASEINLWLALGERLQSGQVTDAFREYLTEQLLLDNKDQR